MFREQVGQVSNWFDRWTDCEKTVAMVALLRRLQPTQARFITSVLHKQLSESAELRRAEILANDPNFVSNFEGKEGLVRDLLIYLPLLNPKNTDVKNLYLALIPKVLAIAIDHCSHMEEARQILSYSLIHPAFTVEDRGLFATWLHQFEEKLAQQQHAQANGLNTSGHHYPSSGSPPSNEFGNYNNSPPSNNASLSGSPASQSGLCIGNFGGNNLHRIRRSNSLTPPVLHSDAWSSPEDMCSTIKPRSLSLSSEASPQGSLASSGSESHLDDPRPTFNAPGMRDVQYWLKSLRLHKYSFLFAHLTFEEMMSLNEDMLEAQGVTKGARHKIVLSIGKLKERPAHLKKILDEMTGDKENIRNALSEIKWILTTPIKPAPIIDESGSAGPSGNPSGNANTEPNSSSEWPAVGENTKPNPSTPNASKEPEEIDLPTYIVRVVGKACELNPDMECEGLLVSVLDKCLSHDSFNMKQKRVLSLWRQQLGPIRRNSGPAHFNGPHHRHNSGNGNTKHNRHFTPRVLSLGGNGNGNGNQQTPWSTGNSIQAIFMSKRPSLQDNDILSARSHLSVQRTKSAPLPNFFSLSTSPDLGINSGGFLGLDFGSTGLINPANLNPNVGGGTEMSSGPGSNGQQQGGSSTMDITSRLESLCLSMTEAALGPSFNSY